MHASGGKISRIVLAQRLTIDIRAVACGKLGTAKWSVPLSKTWAVNLILTAWHTCEERLNMVLRLAQQ